MGRTHWCHEKQIRGLHKCANYRNGVCTKNSFDDFVNPCKYRHPYPVDDTSLEELCQIFASYKLGAKDKDLENIKSGYGLKFADTHTSKPPNRGSAVCPAPTKVVEVRVRKSSYNPVEKAYSILTKAHFSDATDLTGAHIAMEEAIGFLGEALAD